MQSDRELINAYREGDREALETLISRYLRHVFNFVARIARDKTLAEDITQETFVKAWRKLARYDARRSFKTWLFTIARNTAFDFLRKKKLLVFSDTENETTGEDISDTLADNSPLPSDFFEKKELGERIEKLLASLPPHWQGVLALHYQEELTFEEIGDIFGKPMNTVKSWHRRALAAIQKQIAPKIPN